MKRRGFIGALAAALAGSVIDPDKLLWVPGAKKIFIPKPFVPRSGLFNLVRVQTFSRFPVDPEWWSRSTMTEPEKEQRRRATRDGSYRWGESVVHSDDMPEFVRTHCPRRSYETILSVMELPKEGNEIFYKNPHAYKAGAEGSARGAAWDRDFKRQFPKSEFRRLLIT